ncbi:chromosome-associated kinesin KIF4A-like [Ctenocephalides felis]|uniref:chromosome-associated kinesin KIF4A-like n=1 Tax=Ctenocephalides felis TaxID=7515 RepID=UPI000E6E33C4|nr:chromosome-associated kinesin KIF4A-like [Ctenocephalides felis]
MADSAVSVQVALRIRPLVKSEISKGYVKCLETVPNKPQVLIKNHSFTYNHVFPPEVSQAQFYDTAVKGLVDGLFKGYNVTILAYGQTGSGKTHSMGMAYSGGPVEEMGVIPRAVKDIFQKISTLTEQYYFQLQVSFMELYQEQLFDLLSKSNRDQSIVDIREDQQKRIVIPGLTEIEVRNAKDTLDCLIRGYRRRAVGATAMNSQSSRSHAIFTIHIQQRKISDKNSLTSCKLHLVDLAGSERANKTKATGNRFRESVKINKGLLALGNVISRLGEGCTGFIGYRDSKLTRLLQDSLGGNAVTLMIACVSPADYNIEEIMSTLRYANRANKIKNKPIVNKEHKNELVLKSRQEIKDNNLLKALDSLDDETKGELSTSERSCNIRLHTIKESIDEVQKTLIKVYTHILDHGIEKRPVSEVSCESSGFQEDVHLESSESITDLDVKEQQDNHLSQQAALTTGLQQLNKELASKRTLVAQVAQKVNMPIPEPKYAPKDLFDMIADPRRSVDAHNERGTELENQLTEAVAKVAQYQQEMDKLREQHRHELAELMTAEKKAQKMKKDPDHLKLDFEPMSSSESDDEVYADSAKKDPDFRLTPMYKQVRLVKKLPRHKRVSADVSQCSCKEWALWEGAQTMGQGLGVVLDPTEHNRFHFQKVCKTNFRPTE